MVSPPRNVAVSLVCGNPVLTWSMPLDTPWVGKYEIFIDEISVGLVDGTIFEATHAYAVIAHNTYKVKSISSRNALDIAYSDPFSITPTIDTRFISLKNSITNGSFESGDMGWTTESGIFEVDTATEHTFYDKNLILDGLVIHQDISIANKNTYLLTCVGKGDVDVAVSMMTGTLSSGTETISFDTSVISRKSKIINPLLITDALRVSISGTGIIDGVMLIDLTSAFGHGAVFASSYDTLIDDVDTYFGGYFEGVIRIPKEL